MLLWLEWLLTPDNRNSPTKTGGWGNTTANLAYFPPTTCSWTNDQAEAARSCPTSFHIAKSVEGARGYLRGETVRVRTADWKR